MQKFIVCISILLCLTSSSAGQEIEKREYKIFPFGEGGQIKMLYDRRQRPQTLFLNGKVYVVVNAGSEKGATGRSKTKPMIYVYDLLTSMFSEAVILGPADNDHHYCPIIWPDTKNHLHVLHGCHSTPGTHLASRLPEEVGKSLDDWTVLDSIAPKLSYPTAFKVLQDKQLVYYRTAGHISSWTYRISKDNGLTWSGPDKDVTDLDSKGRFQWSSYQTKLPSPDGRYLHVAFIAYDDNRSDDPERYYNERYKKAVSNEWKYNLYYVKIDLENGLVTNFDGEAMDCPVDLDQANEKCLIWDTEWRGAGVPPDIVIDKNGNPAFLHVLSEENTETHNYHFVRYVNGQWRTSVVAPSNHQWNSCHVQLDKTGIYHAFLVTGESYIDTEWVEGKSKGSQFKKSGANYLKTGGYMDKHGGGRIEEWISRDDGNTWTYLQDISPKENQFEGWRYNNVQPVTLPDGSPVEGMLMFYGWKHKDDPKARAFLLHALN